MKINEPVTLRKMRFDEVPEAIRMSEPAVNEDPLQHYLRDTPKPSHVFQDSDAGLFQTQWRLELGLQLGQSTRKGRTWTTAGNVDAMVSYSPPHQVEDDIDKLIKSIMPFFGAVQSQLLSPQQKERVATFTKVFREAVELLGDRRKEMIELAGLVTRREKQGRGYGSALADQKASNVAGSSNIANTGFYESLGFVTVIQNTVGESDPTWNEAPWF
ncbi:hypothetical protein BC629DRAFT_1735209 [Irpex lacteus]|nr:hypothetical protein BC629DRAFT_1735209 [Irpex lacteus]